VINQLAHTSLFCNNSWSYYSSKGTQSQKPHNVFEPCKRRVNENWNDESYLRKAIIAIENGAKITIAIHVFRIPTTSFKDHLHGNIKSCTYMRKKVLYLC
jgi:hypothetical protein